MSREQRRITVNGLRPYDVVLGHDLMDAVLDAIPARAARVAVLYAPFLADEVPKVAARIAAAGREPLLIQLDDAERAKTAESASMCWQLLGEAGFTRTDTVVGFGGGATTDLAGFVAATWLRGVDVIHMPTTMLAMVDAAVGGKTGINTTTGKNLVGAIHPPCAVICDLEWLDTLPTTDLAAGLAEVVKAGFIADVEILDIVAADPAGLLSPSSPSLLEVADRAIRVKAAVVADDLAESVDRELGREVLNYGHTFAHALEKVEQYSWRHGDAVSVGMCFAAALSHRADRLSAGDVERHRSILQSLGLPTRYEGGNWADLLAAMRVDKKARGATMRFIVLDSIGQPGILTSPDPAMLEDAYHAISEEVS